MLLLLKAHIIHQVGVIMSFYMITYGYTQIEKLYIGKTQEEVISNARELINEWPEYVILSDEEIIEMATSDQCEFDLVKINDKWPSTNCNHKYLAALYNYHCGVQSPAIPKLKPSDYL